MVSMYLEFSGFVYPESSNDEHYNCKLLRERDKVVEQIRRRFEDGSFYEYGLLLDLLMI